MKKIVDYIKAHPCITIVHMLGVLMVLLCFFSSLGLPQVHVIFYPSAPDP